jgi:hypothetical protein
MTTHGLQLQQQGDGSYAVDVAQPSSTSQIKQEACSNSAGMLTAVQLQSVLGSSSSSLCDINSLLELLPLDAGCVTQGDFKIKRVLLRVCWSKHVQQGLLRSTLHMFDLVAINVTDIACHQGVQDSGFLTVCCSPWHPFVLKSSVYLVPCHLPLFGVCSPPPTPQAAGSAGPLHSPWLPALPGGPGSRPGPQHSAAPE